MLLPSKITSLTNVRIPGIPSKTISSRKAVSISSSSIELFEIGAFNFCRLLLKIYKTIRLEGLEYHHTLEYDVL